MKYHEDGHIDWDYYTTIVIKLRTCQICGLSDPDLFFRDDGWFHSACLEAHKT